MLAADPNVKTPADGAAAGAAAAGVVLDPKLKTPDCWAGATDPKVENDFVTEACANDGGGWVFASDLRAAPNEKAGAADDVDPTGAADDDPNLKWSVDGAANDCCIGLDVGKIDVELPNEKLLVAGGAEDAGVLEAPNWKSEAVFEASG